MADISFDDFVDQQIAEAEQAQSMNWPQRREDWIKHLDRFYKLALGFLQKYIEEEKIHIRWTTKHINEDYIGFDPIGTNLIGAKGRVDMHGPHGTVRFVLVPKTDSSPIRVIMQESLVRVKDEPTLEECAWKIATRPPDIKYIELEKEEFLSAIMEVANA